ncbi:hypothetical protein BV20DRAFT_1055451 [Pilatotrama ljubarskyi]|nr:hypothetical protein BV20DRAFT_1055451 [Pilatotrama ljubarskyi]
MVDAVPPPVPMKQPKPSIANVPTSIPARQDPRKIPSSGTSSVLAPAEPANSVNNTNTIPSSSAASHRGQKRKAKDAFVITPLPRPQVAAKQTQSRPSRQRSPAGRDTPASVDAPRPIEMEQRQPSPARASPPRRLPLPSPSSVDINDIRTLISNMRAGGQLKPPPSVDYVLRRPSTSQKCPTPQAQLKAPVERRSQTRDLEEVERKLDDFSMDVDLPEPVLPRDPEPNLELEPVPDPHNIDDLYGDVAPQYRNEPAPPRAKSTAPAQERLLFTLQKKRISEKDHSPLGAAIPGLQSDRARKPRKGPARQLKGKALQKRQADGLFFHVEEVDWGESGD